MVEKREVRAKDDHWMIKISIGGTHTMLGTGNQ